MVKIKVCGVRSPEDAVACADAGVDTLGLNFWPGTPRCVDVEAARRVAAAVAGRVTLVGVFVDATEAVIRATREAVGLEWVQLHGRELPPAVEALLPRAYKAIRVGETSVREVARRYPGERILLDAAVPGAMPGGTGHAFDWALAAEIAEERPLVLAGGLHPGNVGDAIRAVRPFQVDVASGVERAPGVKDLDAVRAFVAAVRAAG
jgi:phosphoribosylanthranilate isomerase